jgi:hypothetical protein
VMQGFNGTVMSYGQTSSGKTHTMEGTLLAKSPELSPQVRARVRAMRARVRAMRARRRCSSAGASGCERSECEACALLRDKRASDGVVGGGTPRTPLQPARSQVRSLGMAGCSGSQECQSSLAPVLDSCGPRYQR